MVLAIKKQKKLKKTVVKQQTKKEEKSSYIDYCNNNIKEIAVKYRTDLIARITNSEKLFRSFLDRNGYKYDFQKIIYLYEDSKCSRITKFYIADFYIKQLHLIVEIDGGYHTTVEQTNYDNDKDRRIKRQYPTINILRIKNENCSNDVLLKDLLDGYKDDFEK